MEGWVSWLSGIELAASIPGGTIFLSLCRFKGHQTVTAQTVIDLTIYIRSSDSEGVTFIGLRML